MTWLVMIVIYVVVIGVFFAIKLNRGAVVESSREVDGRITAIDFYWRPG